MFPVFCFVSRWTKIGVMEVVSKSRRKTYRVEEFSEFGEVVPPASVHHLNSMLRFLARFAIAMHEENG